MGPLRAVMRLCLAALFAVLLVRSAGAGTCAPDVAQIRGAFGEARFSVELADTRKARSRGLMFREQMSKSAGMLFVYPRPVAASFWMKNTLIPLDMIFMDKRGVVTRVHENAVPGDLTPIPGGAGVMLVLEINGGLAGRLGIAPGATLRHPSVPQEEAAWPCE